MSKAYCGRKTNFHSFGRLRDEYVLNSGDGQITDTTLFNCYRGTPPASEWDDLVAIGDYWPGCSYQNWYRPSPLNVMYSPNFHYFNGPSQILINQKITQLVGPIEDLEQPFVIITEPLNNQTVSGIINIKSLLSDNIGVTWGDMKLDGALYKSIYLPPFDFVLDTTTLSTGSHSLMVRARDANQNIGAQTITINVVSPTPTPTPTPIPILVSFSSASYSYRENAKNAIDNKAATIKAIGNPSNAFGTLLNSSLSLIPDISNKANAKPAEPPKPKTAASINE